MDLSKIKLFSALENKMDYIGARQSVIARNIANANTPGYRPVDLKKVNFAKMVDQQSGISMSTTNSGHISASTSNTGTFASQNQKTFYETTPTGNSVVIEEQMLKMSKNSMDYSATTSLYKKMTQLINTAIDEGR